MNGTGTGTSVDIETEWNLKDNRYTYIDGLFR